MIIAGTAPNEPSSVAGPEMHWRRSLAMKIELNAPNFTPRIDPGTVHCSAGLGAKYDTDLTAT
jgi:hypothetical protein